MSTMVINAVSVHKNPPKDSRVVIVTDFNEHGFLGIRAFAARRKNNVWYDCSNNYRLSLSDKAVWVESPISDNWCKAD